MKKLLICGAALAALTAGAAALAQTPPAPPLPATPPVAPQGHVQTRAEVQAKVAEHFARLDTNRDGFVTRQETDTAREAMRNQFRERFARRLAERGPGPATSTDRGGAMFDRLDTNKDGQLSRQEFDAARAFRERRVEIRREGGPDRIRMRGMGIGAMGALHGRLFEMSDANKDGRVSLQEAQAAALRHFDTADVNRDGRLTPEERRQMRQRFRVERRPG